MYAAHIYSYVWYIILPWLWEKKYINKKVNKQSNKQAGYLKFFFFKYIYRYLQGELQERAKLKAADIMPLWYLKCVQYFK